MEVLEDAAASQGKGSGKCHSLRAAEGNSRPLPHFQRDAPAWQADREAGREAGREGGRQAGRQAGRRQAAHPRCLPRNSRPGRSRSPAGPGPRPRSRPSGRGRRGSGRQPGAGGRPRSPGRGRSRGPRRSARASAIGGRSATQPGRGRVSAGRPRIGCITPASDKILRLDWPAAAPPPPLCVRGSRLVGRVAKARTQRGHWRPRARPPAR